LFLERENEKMVGNAGERERKRNRERERERKKVSSLLQEKKNVVSLQKA
jgi:hypothetical protein